MERVIERSCGLDVHKKTVVACVRLPGRTSAREQHVRTFGTTTAELLALRDWLGGYGVTHVAMESTGVYWKPIFYVLEDAFTCVLANAAQVPGRKTDVKDGRLDCATAGAWARAGKLCRQHRSASSEISRATAPR
jgi:transposase